MRRLLRTATFRLTGLYVIIFAISAGLLGGTVILAARSALEQQMTARIETDMAYLQGEFRAGGLDRMLMVIRSRERGSVALDYLVQDRAGKHLGGEIQAVAGLRPGWTTLFVKESLDVNEPPEHARLLVADLGGGLLLAVADDLEQIAEIEGVVTHAFLWSVGLVALLGIGGGVLLSRAFLARVDAISRTADAIISGDLTRRVPVRGTNDDLDRLAGTLNHMLDRIVTLMDSVRQVSADVAHDLRTPLTRLYQRLEGARLHARTIAEFEIANDAAIREAEGLLETFAALLRIAQVEGASPQSGFRSVDLSAMASVVVDAYRPDAEESGRFLIQNLEPSITVQGDQELLTQALANLIENALRHTPPGTNVTVSVMSGGGAGCRLVVEDDGPGVQPKDLPRLTDRFYRADSSRTTPGNGLGLSLVSAVADLHEARLHIDDCRPGLRVRLHFKPASSMRHPATKSAA